MTKGQNWPGTTHLFQRALRRGGHLINNRRRYVPGRYICPTKFAILCELVPCPKETGPGTGHGRRSGG